MTLANGDRVKMDLQRKIPVYIIYLTAFDSAGHVAFRDDLYELDEPLIQALTARVGSVTRPGATVPASS